MSNRLLLIFTSCFFQKYVYFFVNYMSVLEIKRLCSFLGINGIYCYEQNRTELLMRLGYG